MTGLVTRRRVGWAALVLVLAGSPLWGPPVLRPMEFFAVRRIEVTGARYLSANTVVEAMGLAPDASVFSDLDELAERVGTMGGVARAVVTRRLPGTLKVAVREVEPVALAVVPGGGGLVAVGSDGRPLPFDAASAPVDAPLVSGADRGLMTALATIQGADPALFGAIVTARLQGGGGSELVLETNSGLIRLPMPVQADLVGRVSTVRRDLEQRSVAWRELDGRFGGWVIVRKASPPVPGAPAGAA